MEAKLLTHTADIVSATHEGLSHGVHDTTVPAVADHLAAAGLSGPTAACSLAQVRWRAQHSDQDKDVTHRGLSVSGTRVVKGGAAFTTPAPSGLVALQPTVVHPAGGSQAADRAVEECFVIDEQARVLKHMYWADARARGRRAALRRGAPSCTRMMPQPLFCANTVWYSRSGRYASWSSPCSILYTLRGSRGCRSVRAWPHPVQQPCMLLASYTSTPQRLGRKVNYRSAVHCRSVSWARTAIVR